MMKHVISIFLCCICCSGYGQFSKHIIVLKDKQQNAYSLTNPSGFLSPKALNRRTKYNLAIDSTDLPVSKVYLDSIRLAGNVKILNTSKWLNQVLIETTDNAALQKINQFPFVLSHAPIAKRTRANEKEFEETVSDDVYYSRRKRSNTRSLDYGNSFSQVHIHEGEYLHDNGFRGQGMSVAIFDAGFLGYLTNSGFDSIRNNNRIAGTWDFVKNEASVNEDHVHGMWCFSIMAANKPGQMVGTAPDATYYLFRTEDAASEYPIEEQNWAAAAEMADSLGVDLISSSLGYTEFDNAAFDHDYSDMNGDNTIITRAADFAAKKGMIVTNSVGNYGGNAWKYLVAPSDGDSVLAVGAVNASGQIASFSSYGPSADGRVKPDVVSVGWNTFIINTSGNVAQGNGTSFSNPNIAGLITCLWQAFPEFNNIEILNAVKQSASKYATSDERFGYGIPNVKKAYELLLSERQKRNVATILGDQKIKVYPIPFSNQFTILFKASQTGILNIDFMDATGRIISRQSNSIFQNDINLIDMKDLGRLPHGIYFIRYNEGGSSKVIRLVK
jgi:serine protease AprX